MRFGFSKLEICVVCAFIGPFFRVSVQSVSLNAFLVLELRELCSACCSLCTFVLLYTFLEFCCGPWPFVVSIARLIADDRSYALAMRSSTLLQCSSTFFYALAMLFYVLLRSCNGCVLLRSCNGCVLGSRNESAGCASHFFEFRCGPFRFVNSISRRSRSFRSPRSCCWRRCFTACPPALRCLFSWFRSLSLRLLPFHLLSVPSTA